MRAWLLTVLVACGSPRTSTVTQPSGPVLYDRIGRMDAIKGIVKDFVEDGLKKGPLAARFASVDAARFEESLATQLCELSGGPCKYTGKPMREAHAGMAITDADFDAFVAAFEHTLAKFKVEPLEQKQLVEILRKQRDQIVQ
jgi:hemoglobin